MLGKHDLDNFNESGSRNVSVSKIILHPEWNVTQDNFNADIAIVILNEKIEFTRFIRPICLPEQDNNEADVVGLGWIAGWGRRHQGERHASKPSELEIPAIKPARCLATFSDLVEIFSVDSFCGGFVNEGKGACMGDSGGGLFFFDNSTNSWIARGIVSSSITENSNGFCDVNKFHLYTNVARFVNWIESIVETTKEFINFECKARLV
jgi:secreted trypsin-like serine protease